MLYNACIVYMIGRSRLKVHWRGPKISQFSSKSAGLILRNIHDIYIFLMLATCNLPCCFDHSVLVRKTVWPTAKSFEVSKEKWCILHPESLPFDLGKCEAGSWGS